jgi:hypothetical protein
MLRGCPDDRAAAGGGQEDEFERDFEVRWEHHRENDCVHHFYRPKDPRYLTAAWELESAYWEEVLANQGQEVPEEFPGDEDGPTNWHLALDHARTGIVNKQVPGDDKRKCVPRDEKPSKQYSRLKHLKKWVVQTAKKIGQFVYVFRGNRISSQKVIFRHFFLIDGSTDGRPLHPGHLGNHADKHGARPSGLRLD